MSAEKGTRWDAPAHTIAKIEMLRKYLVVWLSILSVRGSDLWYVDGFAGPGEYTNYPEGSPLAALRAAEEALENTPGWEAGDVHCVFIEEDPERFANLAAKLAAIPENPRIKRHLFNGTFVDGIEDLRRSTTNPFDRREPMFAFIDPFGIKGLPFSLVRDLLCRDGREVLINFDSDGIYRVYSGADFANHRVRLNEIFGDEGWEQELGQVSRSSIAQTVLTMYKRRIRNIPAPYAFAFEMQSKSGRIDYHLVFATRHPLGLEKMKGVMKQFAQNGAYVFCDEADQDQETLFRFDDPPFHADGMAKFFRGRTVPYAEVHDYALNESPFTNPKKMLKSLEDVNRITVACFDPSRKKGQYPDRLLYAITIRFAS